jgi:hypothetical protein
VVLDVAIQNQPRFVSPRSSQFRGDPELAVVRAIRRASQVIQVPESFGQFARFSLQNFQEQLLGSTMPVPQLA